MARITINRPERRNAMSWEVMRGLRRALAGAADDPEVRVVVLAGAGDEAFCAGADLGQDDRSRRPRGRASLAVHEARGVLAEVFDALWELGKPTVARVQGCAMAGGFGLALACDLVVASDRARFGAPEVNVGLWPYMITVPLVRSMPPKQALELMLTGRVVDAAEALRLGFVTRVVPHDELDAAVAELARDPGRQVAGGDEAGSRRVLRCVGHGGARRPRPPACHALAHQPRPRTPPRASPPSWRSARRAGRDAEEPCRTDESESSTRCVSGH